MPVSTTLPIMAGLSILGAALGVTLGHSAIAEINPAYFNEAEDSFHADLVPYRSPDWAPGPGRRISRRPAAGDRRRARQRLHRLPHLSGRICSAARSGRRPLCRGRIDAARPEPTNAAVVVEAAPAPRPGPRADPALFQLSGEQRGKACRSGGSPGRRGRRADGALTVIPAKAGTRRRKAPFRPQAPAFAGVTSGALQPRLPQRSMSLTLAAMTSTNDIRRSFLDYFGSQRAPDRALGAARAAERPDPDVRQRRHGAVQERLHRPRDAALFDRGLVAEMRPRRRQA